jgi:hypothetical protein
MIARPLLIKIYHHRHHHQYHHQQLGYIIGLIIYVNVHIYFQIKRVFLLDEKIVFSSFHTLICSALDRRK